MSSTLRNKYCVIGATQSGKTTFVINELLPAISYDSILLCGGDHNLEVYQTTSKTLDRRDRRRRKVVYLGFHAEEVLKKLNAINTRLRTIKKPRETLVIFDDFIDPKAIRSQLFLEFIATCRHSRITVIFICHSVDIVVTSFMKTNMSHFIICQYSPSRNFSEFMATFLDPIVTDGLLAEGLPSEKKIRATRDGVINTAFNGRFGKLIIHVTGRRYAVVRPKIRDTASTNPESSPQPDILSPTTDV